MIDGLITPELTKNAIDSRLLSSATVPNVLALRSVDCRVLAGPAAVRQALIQERIRHVYRRQRPTPLPGGLAEGGHQTAVRSRLCPRRACAELRSVGQRPHFTFGIGPTAVLSRRRARPSARLLERLLTEHAHRSNAYTQFISHPCPYFCSGGACRAGPPGGSATADQLL